MTHRKLTGDKNRVSFAFFANLKHIYSNVSCHFIFVCVLIPKMLFVGTRTQIVVFVL